MESPLLTLTLVGLFAALLGFVAHKARLPAALGYLAAGLAFSPAVTLTPTLDADILHQAANVGTLFLLFVIGLELDVGRLRKVLSEGAVAGTLGIVVPALAGAALGRLWGWGIIESVVLGMTLALGSTLLGERLTAGAIFSAARGRVLGILVVEDILAGGLLATLVVLDGGITHWYTPGIEVAQLLLFFLLIAGVALLVVPRLMDAVARTHQHDLVVLAAVGLVLALGYVGNLVGSAPLGALLAGVATAEAGSRFVVRNAVVTLRDVSLALFFFTTGATVNLGTVLAQAPMAISAAGLFVVVRASIHASAAMASGLDGASSIRAALALSTVGEFSLILATVATSLGLAHPDLQATIVGVALILLFAAPGLVAATPWIMRQFNRLPAATRDGFADVLRAVRRDPKTPRPKELSRAWRLTVANVLLLATWIIAGALSGNYLIARLQGLGPLYAPILVYGLVLTLGLPLALGAVRRYRKLVRLLFGLEGASGKARARLVDAWVAGTVAIVVGLLSFLAPRAIPVLLGTSFVAIIISTLAWRSLTRFHRALEASVGRVLGEDPKAEAVLDRVLEAYPWGVRFAALAVPVGSPVAGRTILDSGLERLSGTTVGLLQRGKREIVNPNPDELIRPGDTLILLGEAHQLARAEALLVSHGEALRLAAHSRLAQLVETQVRGGSDLIGKRIGEGRIQERTGALLVGVWPSGAGRPSPEHTLPLEKGDRLILLGTPLQLQRAHLLAEGEEMASEVGAPP